MLDDPEYARTGSNLVVDYEGKPYGRMVMRPDGSLAVVDEEGNVRPPPRPASPGDCST